jgi:Tfp pilus assembly protein PilN
MKQQINLYQPMFRRIRPVFAARSMLRGLAFAILGLGSLYAYAAWQVHALQGEVDGLAGQRTVAVEQLTRLEQTVPQRERSRLLASEVERLEEEVERRRELIDVLAERVTGEAYGFSSHLAGLARQRVEGLWLTRLAIRDSGESLELGGSALRPELVPTLVQRLADEPVFEGATFRYLTLDRSDDERARIDFRLRTWSPEP